MAWILDDTFPKFSNKYAKAREMQAEYFAESVDDLSSTAGSVIVGDDKSDNARVQARRLHVDTRKWIASKLLPRKYSDKVDVTSGGERIQNNEIAFVDFNEATGQ